MLYKISLSSPPNTQSYLVMLYKISLSSPPNTQSYLVMLYKISKEEENITTGPARDTQFLMIILLALYTMENCTLRVIA